MAMLKWQLLRGWGGYPPAHLAATTHRPRPEMAPLPIGGSLAALPNPGVRGPLRAFLILPFLGGNTLQHSRCNFYLCLATFADLILSSAGPLSRFSSVLCGGSGMLARRYHPVLCLRRHASGPAGHRTLHKVKDALSLYPTHPYFGARK